MNINEFERTKPVLTMQKINALIKNLEEEKSKTEKLFSEEKQKTEKLFKERLAKLDSLNKAVKDIKTSLSKGE